MSNERTFKVHIKTKVRTHLIITSWELYEIKPYFWRPVIIITREVLNMIKKRERNTVHSRQLLLQTNTVWRHFNTIDFCDECSNRHSIVRPWDEKYWCFCGCKIWSLFKFSLHINVLNTLERVVAPPNCLWKIGFQFCFDSIKSVSVAIHYSDIIMSAMASLITGALIVCTDQRKRQRSASLAFVRGWWIPLKNGQ